MTYYGLCIECDVLHVKIETKLKTMRLRHRGEILLLHNFPYKFCEKGHQMHSPSFTIRATRKAKNYYDHDGTSEMDCNEIFNLIEEVKGDVNDNFADWNKSNEDYEFKIWKDFKTNTGSYVTVLFEERNVFIEEVGVLSSYLNTGEIAAYEDHKNLFEQELYEEIQSLAKKWFHLLKIDVRPI